MGDMVTRRHCLNKHHSKWEPFVVEVSGPKRPHSRVEEETDMRVLFVVDISYVYWIFPHAH